MYTYKKNISANKYMATHDCEENYSSEDEYYSNLQPDDLKKLLKVTKEKEDELKKKLHDASKKTTWTDDLKNIKGNNSILKGIRFNKKTVSKDIFISDYKLNYSFKSLCKQMERYIIDHNINIKKIKKYIKKKIVVLKKHCQAKKTSLCIQDMIGCILEKRICICITKNTLDANNQWTERAIKKLKENSKEEEPATKNMILVISHKVNTLNGNATHCKDVNIAHRLLSNKSSTYKVIFVCSNSIRINDLNIIMNMENKMFDIQYDEAHNTTDGIPAYRNQIENLLYLNSLNKLILCSSTPESCFVNDPGDIWYLCDIIRSKFYDYTKLNENEILSTSKNYSSISDATKISFEVLKKNGTWKDYYKLWDNTLYFTYDSIKHSSAFENPKTSFTKFCKKFNTEDLKGTSNWDILRIVIREWLNERTYYIQNRQSIGFNGLPLFKDELEAYNNGLNIVIKIIPNIFNKKLYNSRKICVISTPGRVALTRNLQSITAGLIYKPYVLGKYASKNVLMYYDTKKSKLIEQEVTSIMGTTGEFNGKIANIIKEFNIIDRALIIIGNYSHTGESITYVSDEYGIIDFNTRLVSTDPSNDYQQGCRCCFVTDRFKNRDGSKIKNKNELPTKYLVGPQKFIDNCVNYENDNDEHVKELKNKTNLTPYLNNNSEEEINYMNRDEIINKDIISVPVKIEIKDMDDENVIKIIEILSKYKHREKYYEVIYNHLIKAIKNEAIEIDDNDNEFKQSILDENTNKFKINGMKCFDSNSSYEPAKKTTSSWKFKNYTSYHRNVQRGFMQEKEKHKKGDMEVLCCLKKYVEETEGKPTFSNFRTVWWLVYKF